MRILIVSSFLPYPLFAGGYVRLYNVIKQLSLRHEITLICEKRSKQIVTEEDIKELEKICKEVIVITARNQWSWQNILKSGYTTYPFLLIGHSHPEMKRRIVETLNRKTFDVVHVETFYIMQNLPKTYLPVVLVEHNIEYQVYERYAATAKAYMRPFLYLDIAKIKYWEEKFWKKATKLAAVSEEDKKKMARIRNDVYLVPNGVDCDLFTSPESKHAEEEKERRILFMGDFKWFQNTHAAEWILKEIWPEIQHTMGGIKQKKKNTDSKLWIVGKNIPDALKQLGDATVIFGENEQDTLKIYKNSNILLAPLKVGGGSSYKIIEAMASGVPVVTTELGAKGIGAKHGEELFVGETSEELAYYILKLLQNKTVYEKMRKKARQFIESRYDWKIITKELEKVYKEAVAET